jgi:dipeptidyl aminopeptidase/acylaminoacyl peptidase
MIASMLVLIGAVAAAAFVQTPPPDTEVFLAPLTTVSGVVSVGSPTNISSSPGYDNQPSFTADGAAVFFTSGRTSEETPAVALSRPPQTDIYRYDIATRQISRVTSTPESEYSPTAAPDGSHVSVIRVESDGTQRVWRFTSDGQLPELVLAGVKPVGYHAWADPQTLVLFVLGKPSTLQIAEVGKGTAIEVARDVGRSIQRIPGGGVSFVQRGAKEGDAPATLTIMELDPVTRTTARLLPAVDGAVEADTAWAPDGTLLMAHGDVLFSWRRGQQGWTRVADLAQLGLRGVTRLAVSPKGDRLAIVASADPATGK